MNVKEGKENHSFIRKCQIIKFQKNNSTNNNNLYTTNRNNTNNITLQPSSLNHLQNLNSPIFSKPSKNTQGTNINFLPSLRIKTLYTEDLVSSSESNKSNIINLLDIPIHKKYKKMTKINKGITQLVKKSSKNSKISRPSPSNLELEKDSTIIQICI